MTFAKINELLPKTVNKLGLRREFAASQICHYAGELLRERFGRESADHLKPLYFKNGTLFIEVSHAGWAQEVQMAKEEILKKLAQTDNSGRGVVTTQGVILLKKNPAGRLPRVNDIRIIISGNGRNSSSGK